MFAILSGSIALLGAFNVLLTVIAIDLLGGDEGSIGYVAAVAGLGSVVGAGATGVLMGRERLATVYVAAGLLFAASVAVIGLGPGPAVVLAATVGAGVGWAFVYVEALTLAQRLAGDDVMSRVFGVMESTMMASQAFGALAVPVLIATVGPVSAILVSGLALGVVVIAAGPTLIRADRLVPARVRQLRALRGVPMFGPLSAPVLERLATGSKVLAYEPGIRPSSRPATSATASTSSSMARWTCSRPRAAPGGRRAESPSARSPCCGTSRAPRRSRPSPRSRCSPSTADRSSRR